MLRIKEIAKSKGLAIKDIAKEMEIKSSSLSRIINGSNTTTDSLQRIADVLQVDISELFEKPQSNEFNCPHCGKNIKTSK